MSDLGVGVDLAVTEMRFLEAFGLSLGLQPVIGPHELKETSNDWQ